LLTFAGASGHHPPFGRAVLLRRRTGHALDLQAFGGKPAGLPCQKGAVLGCAALQRIDIN